MYSRVPLLPLLDGDDIDSDLDVEDHVLLSSSVRLSLESLRLHLTLESVESRAHSAVDVGLLSAVLGLQRRKAENGQQLQHAVMTSDKTETYHVDPSSILNLLVIRLRLVEENRLGLGHNDLPLCPLNEGHVGRLDRASEEARASAGTAYMRRGQKEALTDEDRAGALEVDGAESLGEEALLTSFRKEERDKDVSWDAHTCKGMGSGVRDSPVVCWHRSRGSRSPRPSRTSQSPV